MHAQPAMSRLCRPCSSLHLCVSSLVFVAGSEDGGAGTQAAVVVDQAKAADQTVLRIWHCCAESLAGELADRFDHSQITAGGPGLTDRELAPGGVGGERTVCGEGMAAHECGPFALGTKAQVLDLHQCDHGIVVVGLQEVDVS